MPTSARRRIAEIRAVEKPAPVSEPQQSPPVMNETDLRQLIEQTAYFKAAGRGFMPGNEIQDWLEAEAEVSRRSSA
jgi:hypothetical protein